MLKNKQPTRSLKIPPGMCPYTRVPDGRWKCPNCEDETCTPRPHPPIKRCSKTTATTAETRQFRENGARERLVRHAIKAVGTSPEKLGLGDWGDVVAATLDSVGLTKELVGKWAGEEFCLGCSRRQEALNRLGRRIVSFLKRSTDV